MVGDHLALLQLFESPTGAFGVPELVQHLSMARQERVVHPAASSGPAQGQVLHPVI
jgi:hypothetical protein